MGNSPLVSLFFPLLSCHPISCDHKQKPSNNSHEFTSGARTEREREIDAGLGTAAGRTSRTAGAVRLPRLLLRRYLPARILMFLLPMLLLHLRELLRTSFRWASWWASRWAASLLIGPFTRCDDLVY